LNSRSIAAVPLFFLGSLFSSGAPSAGADWRTEDQSPAQDPASPLVIERKVVAKADSSGSATPRRIDLVWFHADHHTFRVIDNGPPDQGRYGSLAEAMRRNGCLAGCNGGFFLENHEPSGLMIAAGVPTGRFGEGSLLSGLLLSSGRRNPYLLRRNEYDAGKFKATDLIQAGPTLVDRGAAVAGLSTRPARRRSFVLHDGDRWFALGVSESLSLAELGEVLAEPGFSPARPVRRALNLDGGTSTGFYLARGPGGGELAMEPLKRVRNFVGIVPR
jgi:hypothetical protein